jgi:hypothetical protein
MKSARWQKLGTLARLVALPAILILASETIPAAAAEPATKPAGGAAKISFNRQIRPILSEACYRCHGPDRNARQAELRLDTRDGALQQVEGHAAIVPGNATASELVKRITSTDPEQRMPPPSADHQLTTEQIKLLTRWIEQGAEYEPHWSFLPPVSAAPPPPNLQVFAKLSPDAKVREATCRQWTKSVIDRFVAAKLEEEGLTPSPEADRATLLRRVAFDITGLPPTIEEIEAFAADQSPDAYEKVVDRLLASPRYGERMATFWLDAARYADTNGYQSDGTRFMWRWRDWVIEAFNANKRFDEFTVEQIAGDLLPSPTLDQRIATGFNRNHRGNEEGGIIPEEFRIEYVADRVETTSTVWLGLTIGCARCHDHKFDPVSQKNFYELFAFFNNLDEPGKAIRDENSPPLMKAPTREMQAEIERLKASIAAERMACEALEPKIAAAQTKWERSLAKGADLRWEIADQLALHYPLDGNTAPGPAAAEAAKPPKIAHDGGAPTFAAGEINQAAEFDGNRFVSIATEEEFLDRARWTMNVWIRPSGKPAPEASPKADGSRMAVFARMDEEASFLGYGLFWNDGRLEFDYVGRIVDDAIRLRSKNTFEPDRWTHVALTYMGSQKAGDFKLFVNGAPEPLEIVSNTLSNPVKPTVPLEIGARAGTQKFRGAVDDLRFYRRILPPAEIAALGSALSIKALAQVAAKDRTPTQTMLLREYYLKHAAAKQVKAAYEKLAKAEAALRAFEETVPTTMVMEEMPVPRKSFVLNRGQYDQPKEEVSPDWPDSLSTLQRAQASATQAPRRNRLDLACWLVDPAANPLTARVAVNRIWQLYFGVGLVKTAEDFGSQGEWPSHPELLDSLAVEFVRSGWDLKALQKRIVMSAAYRQSSKVTPEALARDPENRFLSHGPRFRLSAEAIRDQALALSGLLNEKLGGPSIKPYQPEGLWEELTHTAKYVQSKGADLYRRSLYVYRRRTVPPPNMSAFDASSREACTVLQVRTNTPLQALTLLNDPTYVEASRKFAERMLRHAGKNADERIAWGFYAATARQPRADELAVLVASYRRHLAHYGLHPDEARKLLAVGESARATSLDAAELASYTLIAEVILNLDETVTKQ